MRLRLRKRMRCGIAALALLLATLEGAGTEAQTTPETVTAAHVERWMTELSNWGRWGKEDALGTLNLLTPERRLKALALAREGVSVSLAHTIDKQREADNPRPLQQQLTVDGQGHAMETYSFWYHGSVITHVDALCHYAYRGKLYNGFDASKIQQGPGCVDNGIEHQKNGIIARGVLVDLPLLRGVPYLEPGTPVNASDLEAWEKHAGIRIGPGDVVFLRTGRWARRAASGAWNVATRAAGFHASVLPWLRARDVALLGNDGVTDVQPSGVSGSLRPIHQVAIVAMGLALVDVLDLEAVSAEAAKRKRWDFLLTASVAPVLGGTGFPINPIATF
ncbi:MAG: cyclase family protein [Polyangiales bacterium]